MEEGRQLKSGREEATIILGNIYSLLYYKLDGVSLVAQTVKNLPAMKETQVQSRLQSMGSQRVGQD